MKHLIKKIPPMNEYVLAEVAHYLYCFCYDVEQDELDPVKLSSVSAIFGPVICKSALNQQVADSARYQSLSLTLLIKNFEFLFEKKPLSRLENIEALEKAAGKILACSNN